LAIRDRGSAGNQIDEGSGAIQAGRLCLALAKLLPLEQTVKTQRLIDH
jgi:hypothetical protein